MNGDDAAKIKMRARRSLIIGAFIVLALFTCIFLILKHDFSDREHPTLVSCSEEGCEIKEIYVDGRRARRSILIRSEFDLSPGMRDIEVRTNIGVVKKRMEIAEGEVYCYIYVASQEILCSF